MNIKELTLHVVWRLVLPTSKALGKWTPSQELSFPRLNSKGPKYCLRVLLTLTFFKVRGTGTFWGMSPSSLASLRHLEDGEGLSVEVQNRVGMVPLALWGLELVADLDTDAREAVLLAELPQSHQVIQDWSGMWGKNDKNTFKSDVVIIRNKQWKCWVRSHKPLPHKPSWRATSFNQAA